MAEIAKVGTPSLATPLPCDANKLPALPVGEDVAAGDACYVSQADGKVYRSDGSAAGVLGGSAEVDGYAMLPAKVAQRQTVVLHHDVNVNYGTGFTAGRFFYLSTTVLGGLTDTVGAKQTRPVARTVDGTRVRVLRTY